MRPDLLYQAAIKPALSVLPPAMTSPQACVMLLAIAGQESAFLSRWQKGGGPARGYWQCEREAVEDVWQRQHANIQQVLIDLDYVGVSGESGMWAALPYDATLAAAVARLILYLDRAPLPATNDPETAWDYYLRCWRPGRPDKNRWPNAHKTAVNVVAVTP